MQKKLFATDKTNSTSKLYCLSMLNRWVILIGTIIIKYVQEFQIHELDISNWDVPLYNNIMYISYFFDLQDEKIPSEGRSNQNMCYWWFFRLDSPLFNRYTLSCYYLKALDICFFRFNNECKTSKSCSTLAPFIMRTLRVIYNLKYYYFR